MADLILNVDFAPAENRAPHDPGNRKHRSFLRRRRLLERRGVLRQRQVPAPGPGPQQHPRTRGRRGGRRRAAAGTASPPGTGPGAGPTGTGLASKAPPHGKAKGGLRAPRVATKAEGGGPGAPRVATKAKGGGPGAPRVPTKAKGGGPEAPRVATKASRAVAIDCEMVGTGPGGRTSSLARCSVVGYGGHVLYDRYVRPDAPIVDYRTRWSGIRPRHMATAIPFATARRQILRLLAGRVVVGHAITNDFKALRYFHPEALTRDTSKIPLLNRRGGFPENVAISLKRLAKELLHKDIQVGKSGHSSVEDAQATMELYKVVEAEWEQHLLLNSEQQ